MSLAAEVHGHQDRGSLFDHYPLGPSRPSDWSAPQLFDLTRPSDEEDVHRLLRAGAVTALVDHGDEIAADLFDHKFPGERNDGAAKREFVEAAKEQGDAFGTFVYFPWLQTIVRYARKEDHLGLITSRNRNLITAEEQQTLYKGVTILNAGQSVGASVTEELAGMGIGDTHVIADPDVIDYTNLNRIRSGVMDLGLSKVDRTAKVLSLYNPWINIVPLRDGITPSNLLKLTNTGLIPSLIVEAVDDMPTKARLRLFAEQHRTPLVMPGDFGDNSVIHVERYDLEETNRFGRRKPIMMGGRLSAEDTKKLASGEMDKGDRDRAMLKHAGITNLSAAMMGSLVLMDSELGGLPQLRATTTRGAANVAFAARQILLARDLPSGVHKDRPRRVFGTAPDATAVGWLGAAKDLAKFAKQR